MYRPATTSTITNPFLSFDLFSLTSRSPFRVRGPTKFVSNSGQYDGWRVYAKSGGRQRSGEVCWARPPGQLARMTGSPHVSVCPLYVDCEHVVYLRD